MFFAHELDMIKIAHKCIIISTKFLVCDIVLCTYALHDRADVRVMAVVHVWKQMVLNLVIEPA